MPKVRFNVSYQGLLAVYPSPTGLQDTRTGLAEQGGGLNVGEWVEFTEDEAQALSPLLHTGRYRFVKLDPGATLANLVKGAVLGFAFNGTVAQAAITGAGSGQTPGTYTVAASGGGGTGAVLQYVIGSGGTVISATILTKGSGYTSVPTFTLAAGGTPGTVVAQMTVDPNNVTSYDQGIGAGSSGNIPRAIFLGTNVPLTSAQLANPSYIFVQEEGIATVLAASSGITGTTAGVPVNAVANSTGVVNTVAMSTAPSALTIGFAVDAPVASSLFRVELDLPPQQA